MSSICFPGTTATSPVKPLSTILSSRLSTILPLQNNNNNNANVNVTKSTVPTTKDTVSIEGWLQKYGNDRMFSKWKNYHFFIMNNYLCYSAENITDIQKIKQKNRINLDNVRCRYIPDMRFQREAVFCLICTGKIYFLQAPSKDEREKWCGVIVPLSMDKGLHYIKNKENTTITTVPSAVNAPIKGNAIVLSAKVEPTSASIAAPVADPQLVSELVARTSDASSRKSIGDIFYYNYTNLSPSIVDKSKSMSSNEVLVGAPSSSDCKRGFDSESTPSISALSTCPHINSSQQLTESGDGGNDDEDEDDCVDWNKEYQKLLKLSTSSSNITNSSNSSCIDLAILIGQFQSACEDICKTIIDELSIPDDFKTILPIDTDNMSFNNSSTSNTSTPLSFMYLRDGIFFNIINNDNSVLNVNLENELKIIKHECKGTSVFRSTLSSEIGSSLATIIKYSGFFLYCVAVLPVNGTETILHGFYENDFYYDEKINTYLNNNICNKLHIKKHVLSLDMDQPIEIHLSADTQIHKGSDSQLYIMNLSKLIPADCPNLNNVIEIKTRLFRYEYLKSLKKSLSSDVFVNAVSMLACDDDDDRRLAAMDDDDYDAIKTSQFLIKKHIPSFVTLLDSQDLIIYDNEDVVDICHSHGINMRYIGNIANLSRQPFIIEVFSIEMLCRCMKYHYWNDFRSGIMQSYNNIQHAPLKDLSFDYMNIVSNDGHNDKIYQIIIQFFNKMLCYSGNHEIFYNDILLEIKKKYNYTLNINLIYKPALFLALQRHVGVRFLDSEYYQFSSFNYNLDENSMIIPSSITSYYNTKYQLQQRQIQGINIKSYTYCDWLESLVSSSMSQSSTLYTLLDLHMCLHGPKNNKYSILCNKIAIECIEIGDYNKCIEYCESGLRGIPAISGSAVRIYITLAHVYFIQQNIKQFTYYYNYVEHIIKYIYGESCPLLIILYNTIGQCYWNNKQYQECIKLFNINLNIIKKNYGSSDYKVGEMYEKVAMVERDAGNTQHVILFLEAALRIYEIYSQNNHMNSASASDVKENSSLYTKQECYINCLYNIAAMYEKKGDLATALSYALKSSTLRLSTQSQQPLAFTHQSLLLNYYQIANISYLMDNHDLSIEYYEKIFNILKHNPHVMTSNSKHPPPSSATAAPLNPTLLKDNTLEIQHVLRIIIKIKFRGLSIQKRSYLQNSRKYNTVSPSMLASVIHNIYDCDSPNAYIDILFNHHNPNNEADIELAAIALLVADEDWELHRNK